MELSSAEHINENTPVGRQCGTAAQPPCTKAGIATVVEGLRSAIVGEVSKPFWLMSVHARRVVRLIASTTTAITHRKTVAGLHEKNRDVTLENAARLQSTGAHCFFPTGRVKQGSIYERSGIDARQVGRLNELSQRPSVMDGTSAVSVATYSAKVHGDGKGRVAAASFASRNTIVVTARSKHVTEANAMRPLVERLGLKFTDEDEESDEE